MGSGVEGGGAAGDWARGSSSPLAFGGGLLGIAAAAGVWAGVLVVRAKGRQGGIGPSERMMSVKTSYPC